MKTFITGGTGFVGSAIIRKLLAEGHAIRALVRRGANVVLARDLTDTMYNPAMPPHVSHDEGTRLVVDYIEKNYCPTLLGEELR